MQNILIPTDFSENAQKAARYALTVFGDSAEFTLFNTYEVPYSAATMLITIADILEKDSLQLLRESRSALEEEFPGLTGRVEVEAQMGTPTSMIRALVGRGEFDMVVMGTKGASGLKGALVGSIASNTMNNLKCPVIAVPESAEFKMPEKILFAADDQCLREGTFPKELADMAGRLDAEVMVLNVIHEGEEVLVDNKDENCRDSFGTFDRPAHSFHFVEDGDVNHGIEKFIQGNKVDMLAMLTRKDDLFEKLFGLSVTKQMMLHTKIPLAVFH